MTLQEELRKKQAELEQAKLMHISKQVAETIAPAIESVQGMVDSANQATKLLFDNVNTQISQLKDFVQQETTNVQTVDNKADTLSSEVKDLALKFDGLSELIKKKDFTGPKGDSIKGDKGDPGKDGYTPKKGKDYFDGKDAQPVNEDKIINSVLDKIPKPKNGNNGKDGSPDTAEQVVDKINSLKGKEHKIKHTRIDFPIDFFNNPVYGSTGSSTFLDLTDTPNTYDGFAGYSFKVNGVEKAIEYYLPTDTDEKVKTSATDPIAGYLDTKIDSTLQVVDDLLGVDLSTLSTYYAALVHNHDDLYYTKAQIDTSLAGKENTITAGTTAQYWRGDKTWQALDTSIIPENGNLYYTNARADARIALQKGAANGIAPLGSDSKIPTSYLPAIAVVDVFVVASQAAQLALVAQEGDVAVRTDLNKSYIHNGGISGTMSDWQELLTPTDQVLSVNGQTGIVNLTTTNIPEGINLYYTDGRVQTYGDNRYLQKSNNLSDVANIATARTSLGLGNGDSPIFTGLTLSGITAGSILFAGTGGVLSQSNSNLFWDYVNNRFGIGTAAPGSKFELSDNATTTISTFNNTIATGRSIISSKNTNSNAQIDLRAYGASYSETLFGNAMGHDVALIGQPGTGNVMVIGNFSNGPLTLGTNNAERMRIDASGNVMIATASTSYKLDVNGTFHTSGNSTISGSLQVDSSTLITGNLEVDSNVGIGAAPTVKLDVIETSITADRGIAIRQFSNDTVGGAINLRKARGTLVSPVAVASGDVLGIVIFGGYQTTTGGYVNGAALRSTASQAFTSTLSGSKMEFMTTTIGAGSVSLKMTLDDTGKLGIGIGTPDTKLHISATDGTGAITLGEESITPASPDSGAECRMYMKADKLVIQYNDAGTVRYKYLDLVGTGITWVHTTTAP